MHTFLFEVDLVLFGIFLLTGLSPVVVIKEFHHGYIGDALVLLSFLFGGILLALVGLAFRLDDTYQHVRQAWFNEPLFESPLHKFYAKFLWPLPIVQKLNAWLDSKFGKKP